MIRTAPPRGSSGRRAAPRGHGPRRPGLRRMLAIALAAAATLSLAACDAVPGSGPVHVGLTDLKQAEQYVQFNPLGPVAGSSQEDIVRGFVQAATSSVDDYSVAREFLSPEYASQWDPYYGVLIDEGSRPYSSDGESAGTMRLAASAKVDASGLLQVVQPGPSTDVRFEFERVGGEWRISSAPAGIILDRETFNAIWSSHPLYFVGAGNTLVPETRWFLTRAALATEIVSGLLSGPGEGMAEVVHSGFPAGTKLASGAVTIDNGRARIDLTGDVLEAGSDAAAEMYQQLKASLQSVPGLAAFDIYSDGTLVRPPQGGPEKPQSVNEPMSTVILTDGRFGTASGGELKELPVIGPPVAELEPRAVMLSADGAWAAVRNADGVSRVDDSGTSFVDGRAGVLDPSLDSLGYLWTAHAGSTELTATSPAGQSISVPAPWLADRKVVAVQLSFDGSRVAALVGDGESDSAVLVAGIVRDEHGVPERTTEAADAVLWTSGVPVDLDWIDGTRLAVLSRTGTSSRVTVGGAGAFSEERGSVPGGVQIASTGLQQLRVLGSDGDLYTSQGSGWQRIDTDISVLAKRG